MADLIRALQTAPFVNYGSLKWKEWDTAKGSVNICNCDAVHWPEEELQLSVEVPDERASGDYLSVAVIECQAAVAHVLTVDAFGSRGDTNDLCFLHICACRG